MKNLQLKVDLKRMNAYLTIPSECKNSGDRVSKILDFLAKSKIEYGLNRETLTKIVERKIYDRPIKVATGLQPVNGEDGRVEFSFQTNLESKPKLLSDGSVDYRDIQLAQNVRKGEVLARLIPPKKGTPGKDIHGADVAPVDGQDASLVAGDNTEFQDEEETILIARVDGSVKLRLGNRVVVDTIFRVIENVDFSTGNLEVNGDVVVGGSVLSGFRVKATGNVVVNQTVEDGIIEAGGDVLVRRGFVGSGKGLIKAGGKVVLKYIHNQEIRAGTNIEIGEEAFHAKLNAGASIVLTKGVGIMVGGEAHAGKSIDVKIVGNDQNTQTRIAVAEDPNAVDNIKSIESRIMEVDVKLEEIMSKMMNLMEQVSTARWSDHQKRLHKSLEANSLKLEEKKEEILEEKKILFTEIEKKVKNAYIRIQKQIFPGTEIQILWLKKRNDTERGKTEYRFKDEEIVIL